MDGGRLFVYKSVLLAVDGSLLPLSGWIFFFQVREATSSTRMSVGFIGAGQLAHALVKGFTAAGEDSCLCTQSSVTDVIIMVD